MKTLKVTWFNQLKGFGEATDKNGNVVFVHWRAITGNRFKTLEENEVIKATVKFNQEYKHYAYEVVRSKK